MRRIQSTQLAILSQVLEAWIALAMDSNGLLGWWTFRKGNGMSLITHLVNIQSSCFVSYANMDLVLFSTLLPTINSGITRVLVSYDIGCQWSKNLGKRLHLYPITSSFDLSSLAYWRVVLPKFHLAGHGKDCQLRFNINFTHGAAWMTGEMIESGWAQSGSMVIWTRENGPFTRHAVLDDHWSSENWQKLRHLRKWFSMLQSSHILSFHLGTSLLKNLRQLLAWSKTQRAVASKVSECLPAETLVSWNTMWQQFDRGCTKPNPYEEPEICKLSISFLPVLCTNSSRCNHDISEESTWRG